MQIPPQVPVPNGLFEGGVTLESSNNVNIIHLESADDVQNQPAVGDNAIPAENVGLQLVNGLPNRQVVGENFQRENPPANENLRGAVNGTGLKAFFDRIGSWLTSVFSRPERAQIPDEVRVASPWLGPDHITFTREELESMVDGQVEIGNLAGRLSERIERGRTILSDVFRGGRQGRPATEQEAADILLCLHARAKALGEGFARGAFSVSDPDGRLADFLASSGESYVRKSTHLEGLQNDNPHRGIDMPDGINGLPNGMHTVLFGVIPESNGRNQRLFIKPEEYGCRLFRPAKAVFTDALGPSRGIRVLHDLKNAAGHVWTTVRSWFVKGENTRKERIPGNIKNAFKDLVKACKDAGKPEWVNVLNQDGSPLKSHQGIRVIKSKLSNLRTFAGDELVGTVRDKFDALQNLIDDNYGEPDGNDHVKKRGDVFERIGDEVMLERMDF